MPRTRALIREVNERMAEIAAELLFDDPLVLFCECARPGCGERIEVPARTFAEVRAQPDRVVGAAGHEEPRDRAEPGDGFLVVEGDD